MVKKYDANVTIYVVSKKINNFVINLWFKAFVSPYSEIAIVLASSKQFEDRVGSLELRVIFLPNQKSKLIRDLESYQS
jgi:hypothetical protein